MTGLIAGLLAWIAAHTGYGLATEPAVRMAGDICFEQRLPPGCPLGGYYDHHTATVTLREGWTADSRSDVSVLLHELVHHAQAESGALDFDSALDRCRGESEAFLLMAYWLEQNGERRRLDVRNATRNACAAYFMGGRTR